MRIPVAGLWTNGGRQARMDNRQDGLDVTRYVILWWLDQSLYGALFDDEVRADSAARTRNAVYLEFPDGEEPPVILDYYKRDPDGNPLHVIWRDLTGRPGAPYQGIALTRRFGTPL